MVASDPWTAVGRALKSAGQSLFVVEAGAGGALMAAATAAPGASAWFAGGLLCYRDDIKRQVLGLPAQTLIDHGSVSEVTIAELAARGRTLAGADWVLAESGVYGPAGGSPEKPVGLVYLAVASASAVVTKRLDLRGDRAALRTRTAAEAGHWVLQRLTAESAPSNLG